MAPAPNPYKTHVIGAPADGSMPDCEAIEATVCQDTDGHTLFTTAWEPSSDDLAALMQGEPVWLTLWANGLPPAMMTVGKRPFFEAAEG